MCTEKTYIHTKDTTSLDDITDDEMIFNSSSTCPEGMIKSSPAVDYYDTRRTELLRDLSSYWQVT